MPARAVLAIGVDTARKGDLLSLRYRLHDDAGAVLLGGPGAGQRTDGLWRTTCFEAFVRSAAAPGYVEINAAPSGDWASYRFDDYREGMRDADAVPAVAWAAGEMRLHVDLAETEGLAGRDWEVGLSAVIEEKDGAKSYWALRHPADKPDFHSPDCFALKLPAPVAG